MDLKPLDYCSTPNAERTATFAKAATDSGCLSGLVLAGAAGAQYF